MDRTVPTETSLQRLPKADRDLLISPPLVEALSHHVASEDIRSDAFRPCAPSESLSDFDRAFPYSPTAPVFGDDDGVHLATGERRSTTIKQSP